MDICLPYLRKLSDTALRHTWLRYGWKRQDDYYYQENTAFLRLPGWLDIEIPDILRMRLSGIINVHQWITYQDFGVKKEKDD